MFASSKSKIIEYSSIRSSAGYDLAWLPYSFSSSKILFVIAKHGVKYSQVSFHTCVYQCIKFFTNSMMQIYIHTHTYVIY